MSQLQCSQDAPGKAEQCQSVSTVEAVQKGGSDTVQVGQRWIPGEREGGDGGRVSKGGGEVNDKTVHLALHLRDGRLFISIVLILAEKNHCTRGSERTGQGHQPRHFPFDTGVNKARHRA